MPPLYATVTLILDLKAEMPTCPRYCHNKHLYEVSSKSVHKTARRWNHDRDFPKIDLGPKTLDCKLVQNNVILNICVISKYVDR